MVMSGGGLGIVLKILFGETDEGTAGRDGPPSAPPRTLHPSSSFTSNAFVGCIHIGVKLFLLTFYICWLLLCLCIKIIHIISLVKIFFSHCGVCSKTFSVDRILCSEQTWHLCFLKTSTSVSPLTVLFQLVFQEALDEYKTQKSIKKCKVCS